MKNTLYCIVLSVVLGIPAMADDGPSYEATIQYLLSKSTQQPTRIEFPNHCVLRVIHRHSSGWQALESHMSVFNPEDIELANGGGVQINTFDRKDVVATTSYTNRSRLSSREQQIWRCDGTQCSSSDTLHYIWFLVENPNVNSNQGRVAKAVKHLIELCGGKAELF
jgi:hypothetical protein